MFDVAASAYDAFMGRWSRLLAAPFAESAGVWPPMRLLDVGCGTGSLTEELARRVGVESVHAVDPSPSFVEATQARLPGVEVRQAPAERLPYEDGVFDAALAQLVVHFMADPIAGLAEMRRVTRRGGAVAACVWDYAGNRGPLGVFWDAARSVRPEVADESLLAGTRDGHLVELLTAAGLREATQSVLEVAIDHPTFDAWWRPFTMGAGPAGAFVSSLDAGEREQLRHECEGRLGGGPIVVAAAAWAARGIV